MGREVSDMPDEIEVQIPWMRYEITMPLMEGRVPIDGVRLVPSQSAPNGTNVTPDGPVASGDFGLVDLNWGNFLPAIESGWEVVGLPVFSKRKPVYGFVFCRADARIASPRDLEGKRVLSSISGSAIGIWLKGLLRHRYDVDVESITWISGRERWPYHNQNWKVEKPEGQKNPFDALVDGDVDAIMTDISDGALAEKLENDTRIKRLFPNYVDEDRRLHRDVGIYTPVHMIIMSKKLDRQYPDLAGKLFAAFEKAKQMAYQDILNDRAGFSVLYEREKFVEQQREWGDVFKHGITPNKTAIDTFNSYCYEQGIVKGHYRYEQLYAASALDR
jgi:4,5-dihydroxyphthalate decarboxylase